MTSYKTKTTRTMSNKTVKINDVFHVDDRVRVNNKRIKSFGQTATVKKVGTRRLTVVFDAGYKGTYIDWKDAEVIPPTIVAPTGLAIATDGTTTTSEDRDTAELSQLLEHMAFTAGALISSRYQEHDQMIRALDLYNQAVRTNTLAIADTRRLLDKH